MIKLEFQTERENKAQQEAEAKLQGLNIEL